MFNIFYAAVIHLALRFVVDKDALDALVSLRTKTGVGKRGTVTVVDSGLTALL